MATRASRRNLNAEVLIERQHDVIDQAALQAAKGAGVQPHTAARPPPLRTHTPSRTARCCTRAS